MVSAGVSDGQDPLHSTGPAVLLLELCRLHSLPVKDIHMRRNRGVSRLEGDRKMPGMKAQSFVTNQGICTEMKSLAHPQMLRK
jgi:hypothetical protein